MATVRPQKRRRTGHRLAPMVDDGDSAIDSAIYVHSEGKTVLVPIRPDISNDIEPPEPRLDNTHQAIVDMEFDGPDYEAPPKDRWFYMKEFVDRVDGILQAMQAREALADSGACSQCHKSAGYWRCDDCVGRKLLCQFCMRHSHFTNPFHRIMFWMGTHFRRAALWEVGVYLTLPHQTHPALCPNLLWQQRTLEIFQKHKDQVVAQDRSAEHNAFPTDQNNIHEPDSAELAHHQANEAANDEVAMRCLDELLAGHNPDEILEEDEDEDGEDTESDLRTMDAGMASCHQYINGLSNADSADPQHQYADIRPPSCDALSNQYIRVVHTNGIHYIPLVSCTCNGHEAITTDLIYAGWVPTSFVRVQTIFTTALLDHFRCCNLEMRSSAYQFFQMLRRISNPLSPSKVVNLYQELRRLSRLWRWVKKLRWAGYAQRAGQEIAPNPGELGNFCPACPQVGINLPENWKDDPNRWAYRRVLTADGNFKADHVRQKSAASDIWLSDGLGMTTRNSEYKAFLKTAQEHITVSRVF